MMDDQNDRFDDMLDDALQLYNRPPGERQIPFDRMWRSIEAQAFPDSRKTSRRLQWFGIAAALLVGIGIGRLSSVVGRPRAVAMPNRAVAASQQVATRNERPVSNNSQTPLDLETSRYLGQAAALLIALPAETNGTRPDEPFIRRANELLLTTRLLLDSQSGSDPQLRTLLEDLELVLVQVVRLEKERAPARRTELELIQQALDQRDVIPRLRNAASEYAADD